MQTQEFIPVNVFCVQHGIEMAFIGSLQEFGLIELVRVNETECIPVNQLGEAEKLLRLHDELQVNLEGIDVITQLLQRVKEMQLEIQSLRNRLSLYE
jgi:hypothetical protein